MRQCPLLACVICLLATVGTLSAQPGAPMLGLSLVRLDSVDLDQRKMTLTLSIPVYETQLVTVTKEVPDGAGNTRTVAETIQVTVCKLVPEKKVLALRIVDGAGVDLADDALQQLQLPQTILYCNLDGLSGFANYLKPEAIVAVTSPVMDAAMPAAPVGIPQPMAPAESPMPAPIPVPAAGALPPRTVFTYHDARAALKSGQTDRALMMLAELTAAHPHDALPCYVRAFLLHRQGDVAQAEQALREGISRESARRIDWFRAMEPYQGPSRVWLEAAHRAALSP